jgi:hypothetical protein
MDDENFDSRLRQILKDVRLKRPREKDMSDFLTGVHQKVDKGFPAFGIGWPSIGVIVVVVAFLFGLVAFFFANLQDLPKPHIQFTQEETYSLEEELYFLEAFNVDVTQDLVNLASFEELLEEVVLLDELEMELFSGASSVGTSLR